MSTSPAPAPIFGQKTVPTGTATILNAGLTAWATGTAYNVGDRRTVSGVEWVVLAKQGTGTSAASGTGPVQKGRDPFVDNPGANQLTWGRITYEHGIWIYPDPAQDVFVNTRAITVGTDPDTLVLRAGGPPLFIPGPANPGGIYVLAAATGAIVSWASA